MAARRASSSPANMPQWADPLPDMDAWSAPASSSDSRTAPRPGAMVAAAHCKSLRHPRSQTARDPGSSNRSGMAGRPSPGVPEAANARKAAAVEIAWPGHTRTHQKGGRRTRSIRSPAPRTRAERPTTQTGTSAPRRKAMRWIASSATPIPQIRRRARRTAAASADPPPSPAPTGRRFSKRISAPAPGCASSARRHAARNARLSSPSGTKSAKGESRSNCSEIPAERHRTETGSPSPAKATRLSSA